MKKVYVIRKYNPSIKEYFPVMVVDTFERVFKYVHGMKGKFANLSDYPTEHIYTFDIVSYAEGDEGW